jgi:hypothetical protein
VLIAAICRSRWLRGSVSARSQQSAWLADPQLQRLSGDEAYRQGIRQIWPSLMAQLGLIGKEK